MKTFCRKTRWLSRSVVRLCSNEPIWKWEEEEDEDGKVEEDKDEKKGKEE